MKSTFAMLAGYNAWANARVYDAAGQLSDAEYRADRGAFFKSMHGTLNHLLVTDRLWMRRFTGEGDAPNRLDAILFEEFLELRAAREAEDARITAYIDGIGAKRVVALARKLEAKHGQRFTPPKILLDMAETGGSFYGRAQEKQAA